MRRRAALGLVLALAIGCGGGGTTITPTTNGLRVAGTYATAVALTADGCGGSVVMPNPTTVIHTPASLTLQLTHATVIYNGTVTNQGQFSAAAPGLVFGDFNYSITLTGQFTISGFTATVTVNQTDPGHPAGCQYTVSWVGTLSSGTNTIPG